LQKEILLSYDLICASSSPSGIGARKVVRISGDLAFEAVSSFLIFENPSFLNSKKLVSASLFLDEHRPIAIDVYFWKAPFSYTGQNVIELHLHSNPFIVDFVFSKLLEFGARLAKPGEFTLRAFLNGKIDITQVEAIHQVIEASTSENLVKALGKLAGGVFDPLLQVKDDLLNLLSDVEANLDFSTEDIQIIGTDDILKMIGKLIARILLLVKKLELRGSGSDKTSVIFVGPPNVGKSSLFNCLVRGQKSLVSPIAGTTRDVVTAKVDWQGFVFELIDTPGIEMGRNLIETQAQDLSNKELQLADVILFCSDHDHLRFSDFGTDFSSTKLIKVATKSDICFAPDNWFPTSSTSLQGIEDLMNKIVVFAQEKTIFSSAPGISRITGFANLCLENLRRAHHCVLFEQPLELLALELREAIENLGQVTGHIFTDDLLDRMFSRFCVGK